MKKSLLLITISLVFSPSVYALRFNEALPCSPMPDGSYCIITPKATPSKVYRYVVRCGSTTVYVSKRQRRALDAYLRENQNMILRFSVDNEFIDAPCF